MLLFLCRFLSRVLFPHAPRFAVVIEGYHSAHFRRCFLRCKSHFACDGLSPPALIKAAFSHLEQAGGYLANFNLVAHFPMYFHGSGIAQFVVYSIGAGGVALPFVIWFVICYTK